MDERTKTLNRQVNELKRELKLQRERVQKVLHGFETLSPQETRHCRQWFWLTVGYAVATLRGDADHDDATYQQGYATWLARFYYRLMHEGKSPKSWEMLKDFLSEQGLNDVHDVVVALDEEWVSREMAQPEGQEERS